MYAATLIADISHDLNDEEQSATIRALALVMHASSGVETALREAIPKLDVGFAAKLHQALEGVPGQAKPPSGGLAEHLAASDTLYWRLDRYLQEALGLIDR